MWAQICVVSTLICERSVTFFTDKGLASSVNPQVFRQMAVLWMAFVTFVACKGLFWVWTRTSVVNTAVVKEALHFLQRVALCSVNTEVSSQISALWKAFLTHEVSFNHTYVIMESAAEGVHGRGTHKHSCESVVLYMNHCGITPLLSFFFPGTARMESSHFSQAILLHVINLIFLVSSLSTEFSFFSLQHSDLFDSTSKLFNCVVSVYLVTLMICS